MANGVRNLSADPYLWDILRIDFHTFLGDISYRKNQQVIYDRQYESNPNAHQFKYFKDLVDQFPQKDFLKKSHIDIIEHDIFWLDQEPLCYFSWLKFLFQ